MGVVFHAEATRLRRPVALKTLSPAVAAVPSFRQRFLREARAAAALTRLNWGGGAGRLVRKVDPGDRPMSHNSTTGAGKRWKASELRKLPPEQRNAILEAAAIQAEVDYRNDRELTAFEAFGKDDLPGDSASSQTR